MEGKVEINLKFSKPVHGVRVVIDNGQARLHGFDASGKLIARAEMPEEYCRPSEFNNPDACGFGRK